MNKKDMFSIELENENTDELNELLELGNKLSSKDFSKGSNKEAVYAKTLNKINKNKGEDNMKKSNKFKRVGTVAASIAAGVILTGAFSQSAFGQSVVENIAKSISLESIEISQRVRDNKETPIPKELEGKVFDKNGKEVKSYSNFDNEGKYFTASGEAIKYIEVNKIVTVADYQKELKEIEAMKVTIKDQKEINNHTNFNVILPTYLPKGYEFDRAAYYKENLDAENKTKGMFVYYKNKETGKEIGVSQIKDDKKSLYAISTEEKIEKAEVNGVDAAILAGNRINWNFNNVIYGINAEGIAKNDLVKMAESIK